MADTLSECLSCDAPVVPSATICECGEKLVPQPVVLHRGPRGCTCGGEGICLACVIAEYEGEKV